jgi:hypothetical protein
MRHTHTGEEPMTDSPMRESSVTETYGRRDDGEYVEDRTHYSDDTPADRARTRYTTVDDEIPTRKVRETKPAFLTTEFWFAAGGIAALIVIYLVEDDPSLDLFRTALLATLIGIAYIISRGLAKAGSRTTRQPEDPRLLVGHDVR